MRNYFYYWLIVPRAAVLVSIAVTPTDGTVETGQTQQMTATGTFSDGSTQDITDSSVWLSSDETIVSIDAGTGLATGVALGTVTLQATKDGIHGVTDITDVAPPFDISTVNLSYYLKIGPSLRTYAPPANSNNGSWVWQGTPSAGISGGIDGYHATQTLVPPGSYFGPLLDGSPTADFTATVGQLRFPACIASAGARAGSNAAIPGPILNCIPAGIYTATTLTCWALVKFSSLPAGHHGVMGYYAVIQQNGATLEGGNSGPDDYVTMPGALVLDTWMVLWFRQNGANWQIRINNGAWHNGAADQPISDGGGFYFGNTIYGGAGFYGANSGVSPLALSDAVCDNIYAGLKALYPSAALP